MKNCTSCFKKPKLLPSSKGMMEGCPLGCKDSKSCCISCGKSSKFLSMSMSKEAFSKSTGSSTLPSALPLLTMLLRLVRRTCTVSLTVGDVPFSAKAAIWFSILDMLESCSAVKRWLSTVLLRPCPRVSSKENACFSTFLMTSCNSLGIFSMASLWAPATLAKIPAISSTAACKATLVRGAKASAALPPVRWPMRSGPPDDWGRSTGRMPTFTCVPASKGMDAHPSKLVNQKGRLCSNIDLIGSKDMR